MATIDKDFLVKNGLQVTDNASIGGNVTITGNLTVSGTSNIGGSGGGISLTNLSVTTNSAGTPTLTYDNTTGVFSYTPPNLSGYVLSAALSSVATTGVYSDLSGTPTLATVATSGAYSDLSGTPTLATVATSGDYDDLTNKPTITVVNVTSLPGSPDANTLYIVTSS